MPGLPAYQFPCFFGVLHLHEDFYGRIGDHLLRAFLVGFQNTGVVLRGDNGRDAEATSLCQHDLKTGRDDGGVFIHNAEVRPDAHGIRRQGFKNIRRVSFNVRAESH